MPCNISNWRVFQKNIFQNFPDGISKITDQLLIKPDTKHLELEDSASQSNANETYDKLSTFAESLKEICV